MVGSIKAINHINGFKDKTHKIILIYAEKALNKIQHVFIINVVKEAGLKGTYHNIIKATYNKLIILNGEKLKQSYYNEECSQAICPLSPPFSI